MTTSKASRGACWFCQARWICATPAPGDGWRRGHDDHRHGRYVTVHGNINLPAEPITLGGSGLGGLGVLRNLQDANSMASPLSLSSSALVSVDAGSLNLSGPISGNYPLTKTGSGTLVLSSAANNFTGR